MSSQLHEQQAGFTIIELMISITILAVMLTIGTVVMLRIGGLYDKGVSSSNLQGTTRAILSDVSSDIQFSGDTPTICAPTTYTPGLSNACSGSYSSTYQFGNANINEYAYCIGTTRYSFILDGEIGIDNATNSVTGANADTNTADVLWRDTLEKSSDSCVPVNLNDPTNTTSTYPGYQANAEAAAGSGEEMMSNDTRLTNFSIVPVAVDGTDIYQITVSSAFGNSSLLNINTSNQLTATAPNTTTCKSQIDSSASEFCSTSSLSTTSEERNY